MIHCPLTDREAEILDRALLHRVVKLRELGADETASEVLALYQKLSAVDFLREAR